MMDFLSELWQYILVVLLAATPWVEIAVVIPLSIVTGMNPFLVGLLAFLGNLSTVYLLVIFFDKFKQWRSRRNAGKQTASKRGERAKSIWNKYGLPGLSLLGPLLIGSHIAVFIGVILGASKQKALLWMTLSLIIWTVVITVLSTYGIDFLGKVRG